MYKKIDGEYLFSKKLPDGWVVELIVYIYYEKGTYDIVEHNEEGIFPRNHNANVEVNRAYFQLALEALAFIEKELFTD